MVRRLVTRSVSQSVSQLVEEIYILLARDHRRRFRFEEKRREEERKRREWKRRYLKRMQQPEPMPHLVHGRLAQIVPAHRERRLGHAPRQHVAPVRGIVHHWILDRRAIGTHVRDCGREGAVAQEGGGGAVGVGVGGEVGLEVEVQGAVVAAAEGLLHGGGEGVGGPEVVDGVGGGGEAEGDAGGAVEGGEDGDLGG